MQELAWLVCNQGDIQAAKKTTLYDRSPFLELDQNENESGLECVSQMPRPAVMKSHLLAHFFNTQVIQGRVKVILVIRNPKDALVSYYHFYRMNRGFGNFPGTWNEFFELYKAKCLVQGDYFDFYEGWLRFASLPNVLLVKYEDMKKKLPDVMSDVAGFLGKALPDDSLSEVIEHLSFDSMRQNPSANLSDRPALRHDVSPFMRKGVIGDWKNYFSAEQSALVEQAYASIIKPFGLTLEFE